MAEKVIHEIRFIETDDGFRLEVKGDKERMREMGIPWMGGPGVGGPRLGSSGWDVDPSMGFGPAMRAWRRMWRGGPSGHGHHKHGPGFGPWAWWQWWADEADEEEEPEQPPKSA